MTRERVRRKSGRAPVGRARKVAIKAFWVRLVQVLLQHVDHEKCRLFRFEPSEESGERPRGGGAILDKRGEASIDSCLEGRVGFEPRQRGRAALRHAIEAEKCGSRQGLGETLGKARFRRFPKAR